MVIRKFKLSIIRQHRLFIIRKSIFSNIRKSRLSNDWESITDSCLAHLDGRHSQNLPESHHTGEVYETPSDAAETDGCFRR